VPEYFIDGGLPHTLGWPDTELEVVHGGIFADLLALSAGYHGRLSDEMSCTAGLEAVAERAKLAGSARRHTQLSNECAEDAARRFMSTEIRYVVA
jgi:hypothetical protein